LDLYFSDGVDHRIHEEEAMISAGQP